MKLFLGLGPVIFPQLSRSTVKFFFQEFVKRPTIPEVEWKQYAGMNLFGIINAFGTLQDYCLKNIYHLLRVPLLVSYTVEIHRKGSDKSSTKFSRQYVIALGWNTDNFFHLACHLTSSIIPPSRWFPGFWCTQSWYNPKSM